MRVALDAEHFRQAEAGIARYARNLARELRSLDGIEVIEIGGGERAPRGSLRKRLTTLRQDLLWYPFQARATAARLGANIYHSPLPRGPLREGRPPFVVTVHDLVALRFPETTTAWSRLHTRLALRRVVSAADRVITPSADTAADVQRLLGVDAERVRVVWNGVDGDFFQSGPAPEKTDPYVLFVGTPEPRKNLSRLAKAMRVLRSQGRPHRLVIAGADGWGGETPHDPHIQWAGRVTDTELRSLYANASCLALPSLHEGFGLPALEAMASGTPVTAARVGALPEVVGEAAVLVDPLDVRDIARGLERCLVNSAELVAKGRLRAAQFTWRQCAEKTARVYREITSGS